MSVLSCLYLPELWIWKIMKDQYQRTIDYIRISVTDRCNLRCRYCMPEEGVDSLAHTEIMTYEEILRFCTIAVNLGIKKVKITGGEPLVRKGVCNLIHEIRKIPGIESVTVTTNGILLAQYLPELKAAGISGINISLDTLNKEKFYQITRRDHFLEVQEGIRQAAASGIPVKLNCVPMKGFNEEELPDIAGLAKDQPMTVRFIEMMPIGEGVEFQGILQDDMLEILERRFGKPMPVFESLGNGPANYYQLPGLKGKIGFISAVSHQFCSSCNRVRLTADGIFKPCLNYEGHLDIKCAMRKGISDEALEMLLREGIYTKPRCHLFGEKNDGVIHEKRRMSEIGG